MSIIERNIPIFGQERYSFIDALKQYNDIKASYDGAISKYGRVNYNVILPEGKGGTIPVRTQFSIKEIMDEFNIIENTDEAIGFEFDVPLRKGFKANISAELWPWDQTKGRLASFKESEVYYNNPLSKSDHDMFYDPDEDEYVFVTVRLNKENPNDLTKKASFLQSKIKKLVEKRTPLTNRLLVLRFRMITWGSKSKLENVRNFDCREDSIVIEVLD